MKTMTIPRPFNRLPISRKGGDSAGEMGRFVGGSNTESPTSTALPVPIVY